MDPIRYFGRGKTQHLTALFFVVKLKANGIDFVVLVVGMG